MNTKKTEPNKVNYIQILSAEDFINKTCPVINKAPEFLPLIVEISKKYAEYRIEKQFQTNKFLSDVNNSVFNSLQAEQSEKIKLIDDLLRELEYYDLISTKQRAEIRNHSIKVSKLTK